MEVGFDIPLLQYQSEELNLDLDQVNTHRPNHSAKYYLALHRHPTTFF